jgi:hypothetical protein
VAASQTRGERARTIATWPTDEIAQDGRGRRPPRVTPSRGRRDARNAVKDIGTLNARPRYNVRDGTDLWIVYNEAINTDRYAYVPIPRLPGRKARGGSYARFHGGASPGRRAEADADWDRIRRFALTGGCRVHPGTSCQSAGHGSAATPTRGRLSHNAVRAGCPPIAITRGRRGRPRVERRARDSNPQGLAPSGFQDRRLTS